MRTRLYVANLPFKTTEQNIRAHFGTLGLITDVKIPTKNGKFRGICFIGYETEEEAKKAHENLHNSYFGNSKIVVDWAEVGQISKPQKEIPKPIEETVNKNTNPFRVKIRTSHLIKSDGAKVFTRKVISDFLAPIKVNSIRIPKNTPFTAYVDLESETDVQKALKKDKSFIGGSKIHVYRPQGLIKSETTNNSSKWAKQEEKVKNAKPIGETGSLFIRNLSYLVTEDDLKSLFEPIGKVNDITLPMAQNTGQCKGFAHVTYMFPEDAVKAMTQLDNTVFKGRLLHILPSLNVEEESDEKKTFKQKKDEKVRAKASSWHNWNMLFMGSNAIVETICKKYNISKTEVLNNEGPKSLAAKLGIEETEIVTNTKQFLEENGVSLEAFAKPNMPRSDKIFLVKDLPSGTTSQELSEVFEPFGDLTRVVLPAHGLTAIIEFVEPSCAKVAFKKKAYRLFKNMPMYLEWAPRDTFDESVKPKPAPQPKTEKVPEQNATLYVKNLNFDTTEDNLKAHFEIMGEICSCIIAKQKGKSQGYGFVQYWKSSDARKALLKMQDTCLDGHILGVKLSEKVLAEGPNYRKIQDFGEQTSSVIMVRNIPFQASGKDVREIFQSFGQIKKIRLPLKAGSSDEHRGFGFVEYETPEAAKNAFEHLCVSTHLFGRRLALEWAKGEESVDEMRKRTADQFLGSGTARKRKKIDESKILGGEDIEEE